MGDRPFMLNGKTNLLNNVIIGKIIINRRVSDKKEYIQVLDNNHFDLYESGYKAYLFETEKVGSLFKGINYVCSVDKIDTLVENDIIKITNNNYIRILYRADSDDNIIFVTNQCNSNCIMCPDSDIVRKTSINESIDELLEYINCIPKTCKHITITGGEPGMLKENLLILLEYCKESLPNTDFLLLTNGRVFSDDVYRTKCIKVFPKNFRIAIPLYSASSVSHDEITRVPKSFVETTYAIKRLLDAKVDVEIRVVVQKKNYQILENIANYIVANFAHAYTVNFMALEVLGNCLKNIKNIWVDFAEVKSYLYNACLILIKNGISVYLYNFPLCQVDHRLISLCQNSITDYKVRYKDECEKCRYKKYCGGFFFSTVNRKDVTVKPF